MNEQRRNENRVEPTVFVRVSTSAPRWSGLRRVVDIKNSVTGKESTVPYRNVPREERRGLGGPIFLRIDPKELLRE